MLLKCSLTPEKRAFTHNTTGKSRGITTRIHRKTLRIPTKPGKRVPGKKISLGKNPKNIHGSKNYPPTSTALCDNSNDSGLGFDQHESHHLQQQHNTSLALTNTNNNNNYHRPLNSIRYSDSMATCTVTKTDQTAASDKVATTKSPPKMRPSLMLRSDTEDTCSSDDFFSSHFQKSNGNDCKSSQGSASPTENLYQSSPEKQSLSSGSEGSSPSSSTIESPSSTPDHLDVLPAFSLHKQFQHISRDGGAQLQIITQPEQQHRARYQTEGSRGAVKDRSGNGFPVVKLNGYNKKTTLQVFIGNDVGRVSPHIFYQACKVSGKNSTPCQETKTEGTMVIEIELKPENDMTCICDCVGILKERNVDVEHRLGRNSPMAASVTRNKKKSTKCRMVFRAKLNDDSEMPEVLQICSNTITCTQPPGVPEICKKSLDTCSVIGGRELFIIGKNFLKDTKVTFARFDESRHPKRIWEETVQPDKEYLQQNHLICVVPPYPNSEAIQEPIHIQIFVTSSNKKSEPHNFIYLPLKKQRTITQPPDTGGHTLYGSHQDATTSPTIQQQQQMVHNVLAITWNDSQSAAADNSMMPPPLIMPRKSSFSKNPPEVNPNETPLTLKTEFIDQSVEHQDSSTSSTASVLTTSVVPISVNVFGDGTMINVTGMQNPYANPPVMMAQAQVQNLLDGYKMQANDDNFKTAIDLHHIKNEQSPEHSTNSQGTMLTPQSPASELNQAQQNQVVESFINMIVQSSVMNESTMVAPQSQDVSHHHMAQDIILNSPSAVTAATSAIQTEHINSNPSTLIINNAITQNAMICEHNMMAVQQMVQTDANMINPLVSTIENVPASSIVSNAVSDATAETQAVVKQMIAAAAAEILSAEHHPSETQSNINNFISSTLGSTMITASAEQERISTTTFQLQDMLAQELNVASSAMITNIKKEDKNRHQQVEQNNLINTVPSRTQSTNNNITQPFSPTTQDLTTMSENDLISFINPSVFM